MRILAIIKDPTDQDRIINQLKPICEKDSIVFKFSYYQAQQFIENQVETQQLEIDLIITFNNIGNERVDDFKIWLKNKRIKQRTYSNRDFNLNSLPLILILDKNENRQVYTNYNAVLYFIEIERLNTYNSDFRRVVKSWRTSVLDEMDNLGIKFNSGFIDYSYYFSTKRKANVTTKILSENFKLLPRKLNYQWLLLNSSQIEQSIDQFIKLLKRSERIGKKGEEKRFHKFFNQNPHFLLRDNYSKYWYEAKLDKENKKFEEPDFTLKPNFNYKTDLNLIEVKLPNEGFVKSKKYHKSFFSKLFEHIIQVNDYKDYLESDRYKETIEKTFGFVPNKVEYNLLIGRESQKINKLEDINKIMRQLGQNHLNLMTYDELKEYQVKFLDRIGLLEIK